MLFELPELEPSEELERLSAIIDREHENPDSSQEEVIEQHLTQIILRREGESRKDYGDRIDKFISYIRFLDNTSFISEEIKRLQALQKSRKGLVKRLTNMIIYRLEVNQVDQIETQKYKIKVVAKGGKQPLEIDLDETHDLDRIPPEFIQVKTTRSVDKEAISAYLKAGKPLSWARLLERGKRLSIK